MAAHLIGMGGSGGHGWVALTAMCKVPSRYALTGPLSAHAWFVLCVTLSTLPGCTWDLCWLDLVLPLWWGTLPGALSLLSKHLLSTNAPQNPDP